MEEKGGLDDHRLKDSENVLRLTSRELQCRHARASNVCVCVFETEKEERVSKVKADGVSSRQPKHDVRLPLLQHFLFVP